MESVVHISWFIVYWFIICYIWRRRHRSFLLRCSPCLPGHPLRQSCEHHGWPLAIFIWLDTAVPPDDHGDPAVSGCIIGHGALLCASGSNSLALTHDCRALATGWATIGSARTCWCGCWFWWLPQMSWRLGHFTSPSSSSHASRRRTSSSGILKFSRSSAVMTSRATSPCTPKLVLAVTASGV
jgi:hypothetical protein